MKYTLWTSRNIDRTNLPKVEITEELAEKISEMPLQCPDSEMMKRYSSVTDEFLWDALRSSSKIISHGRLA
jgi:hypothetical protein